MIDSSVAFLDSGIGGLPYLQWVRRRRPGLMLTYFADTANFPYGELSEDEVRAAAVKTAKRIFAMGPPRILAVVCNTASVAALDQIRAIAPCPVVGTVPPVKPAAERYASRTIGVLATKGTVDSFYLDRLIHSFAPERDFVRVAAGDIVRYVERYWLDEGDQGVEPVMLPALESLRRAGVGSVVIGCTHFLHVLGFIAAYLGAGVNLVDSRDGVGRRILDLIGDDDDAKGGGGFFVTRKGENDRRYRMFARRFDLDWSDSIP